MNGGGGNAARCECGHESYLHSPFAPRICQAGAGFGGRERPACDCFEFRPARVSGAEPPPAPSEREANESADRRTQADESAATSRSLSADRAALTEAEAVHRIRDLLSELSNMPHADFEGHGGLCPTCGVITHMKRRLEQFRDD